MRFVTFVKGTGEMIMINPDHVEAVDMNKDDGFIRIWTGPHEYDYWEVKGNLKSVCEMLEGKA
jgi:hypothetical protein